MGVGSEPDSGVLTVYNRSSPGVHSPMHPPPATITFLPIPTPIATPPIPRDGSSSSRRRAPRARRSSSRSGCTSRRCSSASTARRSASLASLGQGLRHRRGHRHRQDARDPPDRRGDPRNGASGRRRGEPRARGDAGRRRPGTSSSSPPASRGAGSRTTSSPRRDTLIVDEIHQTSAELELCLALGKRVGCRFVWLVGDRGSDVLRALPRQCRRARDRRRSIPDSRRKVEVLRQQPDEFLNERFIQHVIKEKRGVAVFLPDARRGGAARRRAR